MEVLFIFYYDHKLIFSFYDHQLYHFLKMYLIHLITNLFLLNIIKFIPIPPYYIKKSNSSQVRLLVLRWNIYYNYYGDILNGPISYISIAASGLTSSYKSRFVKALLFGDYINIINI